jgi:hypothetical protein
MLTYSCPTCVDKDVEHLEQNYAQRLPQHDLSLLDDAHASTPHLRRCAVDDLALSG